ncbi:polymer-forming cytoskeletal protein [Aliiglaciecola sp. CAU 1673]|uniref:DUF6701 domain-containing protein n=1 Tax=Aliiglaciecola sp. CAU 1673 TaxID=3032595 RepID=UPI0023D97F55|nr:DUF6701 domain-containing protein [Aliiglaciecola sp. CAU 1673]MDF2179129.1 polymer-forming cytoskeletal protein [Aliiglaciecola sp. CAU 1673]
MRAMQLLLLLPFFLFSAFLQAATYSLPAQTSSLPGNCSYASGQISCSGNLVFRNNEVVNITQALTIVISGDLSFGNNFRVNTSGSASNLQIRISGNVNPRNGAIIRANLTVGGSFNSANNLDIRGNLTTGGNLNLGNNSVVTGNITTNSANISNNAIINGNLVATNVSLSNNSRVNGNVNATGAFNSSGTVTGYVNAPCGKNQACGGAIAGLQCDENNNVGPCTGGTTPISHYRILHNAQGYLCAASSVTIQACSTNTCSSLSTTPATLNLSTNLGTLSDSSLSFTGSTTITLKVDSISTEGQQATLSASGASPNAPVSCWSGAQASSCKIAFNTVGLTVSSVPNQIAQQGFSTAINVGLASGGTCETNLDGQNLEVALQCVNPGSCRQDMFLQGNPLSSAGSPSNYVTTTLEFNSAGQATIPAGFLRYDDAGQVRLLVRNENGESLGQSNLFVVRPAQLQLQSTLGASPVAGAPFDLTVQALGALGNATPNYQSSNAQVRLVKTNPVAGRGIQGTLTLGNQTNVTQDSGSASYQNFSTQPVFSSGQVQLNSRYSEVGNLEIAFRDADYLQSGALTSNTLALGRFRPAYFDITHNSPTLANQCSVFTYVGQPFGFATPVEITFRPLNAQGQQIQNYIDSLNRLAFPGTLQADDIVFGDLSSYPQMPDVAEGTLSQIQTEPLPIWSLQGSTVTYNKTNVVATPFDALVRLTFDDLILKDSDGVCYQTSYPGACQDFSVDMGGARMRYARAMLQDTYGPETAPLPLPMEIQYLNTGGEWVRNTDDNCTPYNATNLSLSATGSGTVTSGKPLSQNLGFMLNPTPSQGQVPVTWTVPQYLRFDWDTSNASLENPQATVSFGLYRGNDRIINWREVQ